MYFPKRKMNLCGGVFNVAERRHNARLDRALRELGRETVLPQREALRFLKDGVLDLDRVALACQQAARDEKNILVLNLDGPDADGGGAVEYGIAIERTGRAITYRTDIRTAPEKELGRNAMFRLPVTEFIHIPCYSVEELETEAFYRKLAEEIENAAHRLNLR